MLGTWPRAACPGSFADLFQRFAYAILAADELVAVSNTVKFRYDDGRTALSWVVGDEVDNAVWITVFLILVIIVNLFPVKARAPILLPGSRILFLFANV